MILYEKLINMWGKAREYVLELLSQNGSTSPSGAQSDGYRDGNL